MIAELKSSVKVGRHMRGAVEKIGDGNLSGGWANYEALSASRLHLRHAPRTRGAAIEAFADVPAQPFQLQSE